MPNGGQRPARRQLEVLRAYVVGSIAAATRELGIRETTARQSLSGLYRRTGCQNVAVAANLLGRADSGGLYVGGPRYSDESLEWVQHAHDPNERALAGARERERTAIPIDRGRGRPADVALPSGDQRGPDPEVGSAPPPHKDQVPRASIASGSVSTAAHRGISETTAHQPP